MSLELHCFLVVNLRSAVFLRLVLCSKMSTLCSDYTAHLRWVAPFAAHGEKEKWFHSCTPLKGFSVRLAWNAQGLDSRMWFGEGWQNVHTHTEILNPTVKRSFSVLTELCLNLAAVCSVSLAAVGFSIRLPRLSHFAVTFTGRGDCNSHFPSLKVLENSHWKCLNF